MSASDLKYLLLFFLAIVAAIGLAEGARRFLHWSNEATRKFVHIAVGILVASTPFLLQSMWPMVILGTLFSVVNYVAVKRHLLTGMHGLERQTMGTVFYPMSFTILVLLLWQQNKMILFVAMMIMAVADAVAAIVGENVKHPIELDLGLEKKTVQGSLAMLATTFVIVSASLLLFPHSLSADVYRILWYSYVVAIIATGLELVSVNGSDNLTVPLGSAFALYYLLTASTYDAFYFTLGVALAFLIAVFSYKLRLLTVSGMVGTFLLGVLVFGVGRWSFGVPILVFFFLSSLLSRIGRVRKKKMETIFEKTGCRDLWQVYANGGLPGILVLIWYFYPHSLVYLLFIAALAAVTADTWATELGILSRKNPRSILTFKEVPAGTSGGVTLLGFAGAMTGALILGITGYAFSPHAVSGKFSGWSVLIVVVAGFFASVADSILGMTVQAQYQCPVCSKTTERKIHCQTTRTQFIRGVRWINNDVVNFAAACSGALLAIFGWYIAYYACNL